MFFPTKNQKKKQAHHLFVSGTKKSEYTPPQPSTPLPNPSSCRLWAVEDVTKPSKVPAAWMLCRQTWWNLAARRENTHVGWNFFEPNMLSLFGLQNYGCFISRYAWNVHTLFAIKNIDCQAKLGESIYNLCCCSMFFLVIRNDRAQLPTPQKRNCGTSGLFLQLSWQSIRSIPKNIWDHWILAMLYINGQKSSSRSQMIWWISHKVRPIYCKPTWRSGFCLSSLFWHHPSPTWAAMINGYKPSSTTMSPQSSNFACG